MLMKCLFRIFSYLLIFTFHQSANAAVAYKDLTIGGSALEIQKHCVSSAKERDTFKCYGIDDLTFKFNILNKSTNEIAYLNVLDLYDGKRTFLDGPILANEIGPNHLIRQIRIYLGPYYSSLKDLFYENDDNPLTKLKRNLDSKYGTDWEFTERDRRLFNEGAKDELNISFANGQLLLEITKVSDYEAEMSLWYSDEEWGRHLMETMRPKNANTNDF